CTPAYLATLADRHDIEPRHGGAIAACGGSDDHSSLDIATTWTVAPGDSPAAFLESVAGGMGHVEWEHRSSPQLADAIGALLFNAYRASGRSIPKALDEELAPFFDDPPDGDDRHELLIAATSGLAQRLATAARSGAFHLDELPSLGNRLGALLL